MSIRLPARCARCGFIFETRSAITGNVSGLSLEGNLTRCPRCGDRAEILDGTYNLKDSKAELVSGPQRTRELFETLQAAIEQSRARGDAPEITLQKIEAQAPGLLRFLSFNHIVGAASIVSSLATVASLVLALRNPNISESEVRRIAREVVSEQVVKQPAPQVDQKLPDTKMDPHSGERPKRVQNGEYQPKKYKGAYKRRAKRRG